MCFDSVNKKLYVLGHYAEGDQKSSADLAVCLAPPILCVLYFVCRVHCTVTALGSHYGVYYPVTLMLMVAHSCCMIIR